MSFIIDCENISEHTIPEIRNIKLIGYYSIDGVEQYYADLSQMKYYIPPSDYNNVCYDLDKDFESMIHKSNSNPKLDNLLTWISENFNQLEKPLSVDRYWLNTDFICRRGTLKTLLRSAYMKDEWIICASRYRNTIYLCEFYTDKKEKQTANPRPLDKLNTARGYKFEQYMVADHPSHKPNLSTPFNENEKFHCIFKSYFGSHSLLYGAEIDGVLSEQPITDILTDKTFQFIELKTVPIYNGNIYRKLDPGKVLTCWSQNYVAGINKIIFGLKKDHMVNMIREWPTSSLHLLSKVDLDLNKCKIFFEVFLDNVKRIVTKDYGECIYKFNRCPSVNIINNSEKRIIINYSEECPDNKKYSFLKAQFINEAEKYRSTLHKKRKLSEETAKSSKKKH